MSKCHIVGNHMLLLELQILMVSNRGPSAFKLVFFFDILPYMCLAALWSPVGKMAKAVVAGQAGPELLDPLFFV